MEVKATKRTRCAFRASVVMNTVMQLEQVGINDVLYLVKGGKDEINIREVRLEQKFNTTKWCGCIQDMVSTTSV